ncbi:D-2-hydroxyacid dehydrogenase [Barnesiella sp. ET7]|uniref:D-2-hydroxyacid dehydrogenase n=1 Tax=Barnesiella sp. ET7 TaxID=2972460 RepID=UPI0021ABB087|nr:D-2-hydroxyacid dehydrogenase [Barnesiella sp. ET7]MCR8911836.1 D-2-hydroxyacid dehydrogenase [Barnesiella sp. ET7]
MKEWKITEGYKVKEGEVSWDELKRTAEKTPEERRPAHRIVALDGYGLNPGDLSWEKIEALGHFTVYDRTAVDEIVERAAEADIVLTNKTPLSAATLDKLPRLRYIGVLATGYNIVDIEAAKERGIVVTNIPSYSTDSVAQMVFAHILNIASDVATHSQSVKAGDWARCKDFCYLKSPVFELAGKAIGIVGFGHIGSAVARIAHAFGMKVLAKTSKSREALPDYVTPVDWETLLAESDVITLHCPLTDSTRNLVNADAIARMKPTAIVINTGRGPLVNEHDLAEALNCGRIKAAGVDVLSQEPPRPDNPLVAARNCYITPHIAWATLEARERLMQIAADNIRQYIAGNIVNQVNR